MNTAICEKGQTKTSEYGGLIWFHIPRMSGIEYASTMPGVGDFRVYQYPLDSEYTGVAGKWLWAVDFNQLIASDWCPAALELRISHIVDGTITDAMLACLDARGQFIEDMRQLLHVLHPGDEYAQGRRAGQEEIKQRIIDSLQ